MNPESKLGNYFNPDGVNNEALRRLSLVHALNKLDAALVHLPVHGKAPIIATEVAGGNYRVDDEGAALFSHGSAKDIRTTPPYDIMAHPNDPSIVVASRLTHFSAANDGRSPVDKIMSGKSGGTPSEKSTFYLFALQVDGAGNHMRPGKHTLEVESATGEDDAPQKSHFFDPKRFSVAPSRIDYHFGIARRGDEIRAFTLVPNPRLGEIIPVAGGGGGSFANELGELGPIDRKHTMIEFVPLDAKIAADLMNEVRAVEKVCIKEKPKQAVGKIARLRQFVMRKSTQTDESKDEASDKN